MQFEMLQCKRYLIQRMLHPSLHTQQNEVAKWIAGYKWGHCLILCFYISPCSMKTNISIGKIHAHAHATVVLLFCVLPCSDKPPIYAWWQLSKLSIAHTGLLACLGHTSLFMQVRPSVQVMYKLGPRCVQVSVIQSHFLPQVICRVPVLEPLWESPPLTSWMNVNWEGKEALPDHPDTADFARRGRNEGTTLGHCLHPEVGESSVRPEGRGVLHRSLHLHAARRRQGRVLNINRRECNKKKVSRFWVCGFWCLE